MQRLLTTLSCASLSLSLSSLLILSCPSASAAEPVLRVGVITSLSGAAAQSGEQMRAGIDTWLRMNGGKAGGRTIEVIYKDDTGPQPEVAKRLATELISRDKVDILAGFVFTPNAMAAASVADRAKTPMVIMNAAASGITARSAYLTRTSYTIAQSVTPLAQWAYKTGSRRVFSLVADYTPGQDAHTAFSNSFTAAGGAIAGFVKVPLSTIDFSAYLQRIKDANPDAVHVFLPNGQPMVAFMKAYREKGMDKAGIRFLGGEGWADEDVMNAAGDALNGIFTAGFYNFSRPGPENAAFTSAFVKTVGGKFKPNFQAVSAYDGMALIGAALTKTGGKSDGASFMAAVKGYSAASPRGRVSIDSQTNDIVQSIYIRRIDKQAGGAPSVIEVDRYEAVRDSAK